MSSVNATINKAIRGATQLSAADRKLINAAPPEERAKLKAQAQLQNQQELVTFITNLLRIKADTSKAIVSNLR